ncbi:MAG: antitoxin Xre-like helix-turn-helix domain-containing protein [Acidobacteriota bacterium]
MTSTVLAILGGKRALGGKVMEESDLIPVLRRGLPSTAVDELAALLGFTREQMAECLALSKRTLARRRGQARLTAVESDRLYRLARVLARATDVLGNTAKAARWLRKPNRALESVPPLTLLDTDLGVRQVEAVLGRIEHGVYS